VLPRGKLPRYGMLPFASSFSMPRSRSAKPRAVSKAEARRIWLRAQRLNSRSPFGDGPEAVPAAVAHLGYVQIDTINVIERCHHHILYTRIPAYRREHLRRAQSVEKSVFEYWTHALAYVPTSNFRFFIGEMRRQRDNPHRWFGSVTKAELRKVLRLLTREGPLTIRDIEDDVLVEKHHPWASRKPSKRALQLAFHMGLVTVSERSGMLKTYELTDRHFGWAKRPRPASERDLLAYLLDRALGAQGLVSLDSVCFGDAPRKAGVRKLIERRVRRGELVPVELEGAGRTEYWASPEALDISPPNDAVVHVLSPFDPLIIQRKRLKLFFDYEHRFEAYVPKAKRVFGYFALPVLVGDEIVAVIDLKTDRGEGKLLLQNWHWTGGSAPERHRAEIEEELHRFEAFQLAAERQ
jgi:uncharacterized protein YcaQ